jgi:acetyl esterase/lipase
VTIPVIAPEGSGGKFSEQQKEPLPELPRMDRGPSPSVPVGPLSAFPGHEEWYSRLMMKCSFPLFSLLLACSLPIAAEEQKIAPAHSDIVFATVDGHELKLNLFLPENTTEARPPLIVFIHGGGWSKGSYKDCQVPWLTRSGFAVASIGYRLVDVATFPAQIHDVKAAVRWLRAHAGEYGYDANRVGACGTSAGGQLALLLGTSAGVEAAEGEVGGNQEQSSRVQAVVDYFGASDFVLRSQTQPEKTEKPGSSAYQLLGGSNREQPEKAKLASAAWQVSDDDPPLLILHGEKDNTVLIDQAERMRDAYESAGLEVDYHPLKDSGHGGNEFFTGENRQLVEAFFRKHLTDVADETEK